MLCGIWIQLPRNYQSDTFLHSLRIIQSEQTDSCPACSGASSESAILVELKVVASLLSARIEENRDLVCLRVN
jgi:hypothetical protein